MLSRERCDLGVRQYGLHEGFEGRVVVEDGRWDVVETRQKHELGHDRDIRHGQLRQETTNGRHTEKTYANHTNITQRDMNV